jgi:hypothetical protein
MRQGVSRRGWLLGLFAGLAGLVGMQRRAMATPAVSRLAESVPAGRRQGERVVWQRWTDDRGWVTTATGYPDPSPVFSTYLGGTGTATDRGGGNGGA